MIHHISFLLRISGAQNLSGGSFYTKEGKLAETAYKQVQKLKRETGYRRTEIIRILVDDKVDITEEVKKIGEAPLKE